MLLAALVALPAFGAPTNAAEGTTIECYSDEAEKVCIAALSGPSYWGDADVKTYSDKSYDEIRLKPTDDGWVPMITGEGAADFDHEVVADTVFKRQDELDERMSGAKVVEYLDRGYDDKIGAEYADAFFMLDLTLFYATFTQRMYKKKEGDRTVLWFEKLTPEMVSAEKWAAYEAKTKEITEEQSLRWAFGSILELADIYGMFVVQPGETQQTRITFVSKMEFGDDAGFIAQAGSQMRSVLRSGLKSGFEASVAIATDEQARQGK